PAVTSASKSLPSRAVLFVGLPAIHLDLLSFPTRRSSDLQRLYRPAVRRAGHSRRRTRGRLRRRSGGLPALVRQPGPAHAGGCLGDRKSTRLNSSHVKISYAVFCLKKKNGNVRGRIGSFEV